VSAVAILLALVALNGLFSMSELAVVSSRKPRLEAMARKGSKGAAAALMLSADPGRFLSAVQIGITLIGIIAGAYSGASLGGPVGEWISGFGVEEKLAGTIGFALVIVATTFISLVIGELVPKQFALRSPEPIAAVVAIPMQWIARLTAPFVWLLDATSALIFRILRLKRESEQHVTAEELHLIVAEASKSGIIEESERAIISGVVRLADRPVREVMTPRTEADWIDINAPAAEIRKRLIASPHSRILVANGSIDDVIGVVQSRDIVSVLLEKKPLDLRMLLRQAPIVPDQVDAMDALAALKSAEIPIALVHDEYGHFEGIVTPSDLLAAIAGDFVSDQDEGDEPALHERDDASLIVAGWATADMLADRLGLTLPETRDYATVAGLALDILKHIPALGETFDMQGYRFEIIDLDGRKIDKLLVRAVEN
jgi:putative hemolysin